MIVPMIELGRLTLRALQLSDRYDLLSVYSDTEAMKYRQNPPLEKLLDADEMIEESRKLAATGLSVRWAIEERGTKRVIGTFIWKVGGPHLFHRIGYALHKDRWGEGYMTEVLNAMVPYLFSRHGMSLLHAEVDENNAASIRLLERTGFIQCTKPENGRLTFSIESSDRPPTNAFSFKKEIR